MSFGALPVARKDLDRLRQLLQTVPRLLDPPLPPRVARGLPHRPSFADAVTWLEVFGDDPAIVEHWKELRAANPPRPAPAATTATATSRPPPRPHAARAAPRPARTPQHQAACPGGDGQPGAETATPTTRRPRRIDGAAS